MEALSYADMPRPRIHPNVYEFDVSFGSVLEKFIDTDPNDTIARAQVLVELSQVRENWWEDFAARFEPNFLIGGTKEDPYMKRWYIIDRNPVTNIYLHYFLKDDDDRGLHSHPSTSTSLLLSGRLRELDDIFKNGKVLRPNQGQGSIRVRDPSYFHRIIVEERGYTFFSTGPRTSEWYFQCAEGKRHWSRFSDPREPGKPGKGCGEYEYEQLEMTPVSPEFGWQADTGNAPPSKK